MYVVNPLLYMADYIKYVCVKSQGWRKTCLHKQHLLLYSELVG